MLNACSPERCQSTLSRNMSARGRQDAATATTSRAANWSYMCKVNNTARTLLRSLNVYGSRNLNGSRSVPDQHCGKQGIRSRQLLAGKSTNDTASYHSCESERRHDSGHNSAVQEKNIRIQSVFQFSVTIPTDEYGLHAYKDET